MHVIQVTVPPAELRAFLGGAPAARALQHDGGAELGRMAALCAAGGAAVVITPGMAMSDHTHKGPHLLRRINGERVGVATLKCQYSKPAPQEHQLNSLDGQTTRNVVWYGE